MSEPSVSPNIGETVSPLLKERGRKSLVYRSRCGGEVEKHFPEMNFDEDSFGHEETASPISIFLFPSPGGEGGAAQAATDEEERGERLS
jgi:hypothetical protein